jgi:hypothetical protein
VRILRREGDVVKVLRVVWTERALEVALNYPADRRMAGEGVWGRGGKGWTCLVCPNPSGWLVFQHTMRSWIYFSENFRKGPHGRVDQIAGFSLLWWTYIAEVSNTPSPSRAYLTTFLDFSFSSLPSQPYLVRLVLYKKYNCLHKFIKKNYKIKTLH